MSILSRWKGRREQQTLSSAPSVKKVSGSVSGPRVMNNPRAKLPEQYRWLGRDRVLPPLLWQALPLLGIQEITGERNDPTIMDWAAEIGGWVKSYYKCDEIPWCGLFMGVVAKRAGYPFGQRILSALEWRNWGAPATPSLGCVLVFQRPGGGHVGIYVGEDRDTYHVLGGNQKDQVSIARVEKTRLVAARKTPGSMDRAPVYLAATGEISRNEA